MRKLAKLVLMILIVTSLLQLSDINISFAQRNTIYDSEVFDWSGYWGGEECSRSKPAEYGPKSNNLLKQWDYETDYPEYICTSGDYVVVSKSEREIVCLAMCTGEVQWTFRNNIDEHVYTNIPPISRNGRIYYASGGALTCFDVSTGVTIWEYECELEYQYSSNPTIIDDTLYILISKSYSEIFSLIEIKISDGVLKDSQEGIEIESFPYFSNHLYARLFNSDRGILNICITPYSNKLYLFMYKDNISLIYKTNYDSGFDRENGGFISTDNMMLYGGKQITAVDSFTGAIIWTFSPKHVYNPTDGIQYFSVIENNVFCIFNVKDRSGQKAVLYSLNRNNGKIDWEREIDKPGDIIACGDRLYIVNSIYSAEDGQKLGMIEENAVPVATANERLFMAHDDGYEFIGLKCYIDDACMEVSDGEMLDFGEYYQSIPLSRKVTFSNCATYEYDVELDDNNYEWFNAKPDSFTLEPGEKKDITFTPLKILPDSYYGRVAIRHDHMIQTLDLRMVILSDFDVLKKLEQSMIGALTCSDVEVASNNNLFLEITNPYDVGLHLSIETKDAWLLCDTENFILPPNNTKIIKLNVDPKRLYDAGLSIESSIELILGNCRQSIDISITTKEKLAQIGGWYCQYGNNQHTNYANCSISESEPEEVWQTNLGYHEIVTQPIISVGKVYIGTDDGVLHCLDASSGNYLWEFKTDKYGIESPSILGNKCYVTAGSAIFCLNSNNGNKEWSTSLDGLLSAPTVANNKVFVTVILIGEELENFSSKIVCFDANKGDVSWVKPIGYTSEKPTYHNGNIYIQGDTDFLSFDTDDTGRLYSINASNGKMNWVIRGDYLSDIVSIHRDKLYTIRSIYLESRYLEDGSLFWVNDDSGLFYNFAINDNEIIAGLWGNVEYYHLKIYDTLKGNLKMRGETDSQVVETPIITNNAGLLLTMDGYLSAFQYSSAEEYFWTKRLFSPCYGDSYLDCDYLPKFSVASGNIFYGQKDGSMHCIGSKKEKEKQKSDATLNRLTFQLDSKFYWHYTSYGYDIKKEMSTPPQILSGSSFLPAKYVVEPLGGSVSWNGDERKVVCKLGNTTIELWIDKKEARVNGITKNYDSDGKLFPQIVDGRTMVPMRFLAENLGCSVYWIGSEKGIVITRQ